MGEQKPETMFSNWYYFSTKPKVSEDNVENPDSFLFYSPLHTHTKIHADDVIGLPLALAMALKPPPTGLIESGLIDPQLPHFQRNKC